MFFNKLKSVSKGDHEPVLEVVRGLFYSNQYDIVVELVRGLQSYNFFFPLEEEEMDGLVSRAKILLEQRKADSLVSEIDYDIDTEEIILIKIVKFIRSNFPNSCLADNFRDQDLDKCISMGSMQLYNTACLEFFISYLLDLCSDDHETIPLLKDLLDLQNDYQMGEIESKEFYAKQTKLCTGSSLNIIFSLLASKGLLEYDGNTYKAWLTDAGEMFLWVLKHEQAILATCQI